MLPPITLPITSGPHRFSAKKAEDWLEKHGFSRFPYDEGTDIYVMRQEWSVAWEGSDGLLWRICFPEGWVSDLGSVPRLLWGPPLYMHPASLGCAVWPHDALHVFRGSLPWGWLQVDAGSGWMTTMRAFTRRETDWIFRNVMEREGFVPGWKRWMAYTGVRIGGRAAWESRVLT